MANPETPEHKDSLEEARIMWAASFLTDWLIPVLHDERITEPNEVIELREKFPPLPPEDLKGVDFTMQDVLEAALRWRAHNQQLHPRIPEEKLPSGKELGRAIDLLEQAVNNSSKYEE